MKARTLLLSIALTLTASGVFAQDGTRRRAADRGGDRAQAAAHGGKVTRAGGFTFEVVLTDTSLRIYATDAAGEPISAKKFAGKVNIAMVRRELMRRANHQSTSKKLGYLGKSKSKGRLRSCLMTEHPLGKHDRQGVRVDVTFTKSPGRSEPLEFRVQLAGTAKAVAYVCANGCAKGEFVDPGQCPKCEQRLQRAGAPARAADAADADADAGEDAAAAERRRRWREAARRRRAGQ